jgi:hypothetical protein
VTLAPITEGLPLPQVGGALVLDGFGYLRDMPPGAAGLVTLPLDAAVVAHSGIDDLRVIDRNSQQIPYLLEKRDEPLIVDAAVERRDLPSGVQAIDRATSYFVRVPYTQLPNARLVLATRARVFKRPVALGALTPATEREPARLSRLASSMWVHADESLPAANLTFDLPDQIKNDLYLIVEEGDNRPLPIEKATILLPSYAIRFFRPADQPLRVVYGKDGIGWPQYDLQLLAPQLMGRRAEEIGMGAEQRFSGASPASASELVPPAVFWSVLALAVVILLAMVARLMRREG